jgi:hypothetical protein
MGGIRCSDSTMAKPLTNRRKRDGSLYERPIEIESAVDALLVYPRATILARLEVRNTRDAEYIPSEAVMHLLRETRADNDKSYFNTLYEELVRRVGRVLPNPDTRTSDGKPATDARLEKVREEVLQRFEDWVLEDHLRPDTCLDIFECKFNFSVEKLRDRAWGKHYREVSRRHPKTVEMLELSIESGDREFASLRERFFSDPTSRIQLYAAIDSLPDPDRRMLQMLIEDFPIESKKPGEVSISGTLGCDPKTVQNRRAAFIREMQERFAGGAKE